MAGAHHLKELAFDNSVQLCSIINAKSGRCMENCSFCAQSAHHQSAPPVYPLKSREEIIEGARIAQEEGSHCYGIVTSGTQPSFGAEFDTVLSSISEIRERFDLEPSASLGLLTKELAEALAAAGCVTYHHNLETARSFFPEICSTHDYDEDVNTVKVAKAAGMKVCCGGIFGLGETKEQRVELAMTLRNLDVDSIPLNFLNPIAGTPLEKHKSISAMDCARAITMFRYFHAGKTDQYMRRSRNKFTGTSIMDLYGWGQRHNGRQLPDDLRTQPRGRFADAFRHRGDNQWLLKNHVLVFL